MIVYNVKRRWFAQKADAEAYRRAEKLPPPATFKLVIDERESLASLLNGLCGVEPPTPAGNGFTNAVTPQELPRVREMLDRNRVVDNPPDFVPDFLVRDWQARHKQKEQ